MHLTPEIYVPLLIALFTYPTVSIINGILNRKKVAGEATDLISHASSQAVEVLARSIQRLEEEMQAARTRELGLQQELAGVAEALREAKAQNATLTHQVYSLRMEIAELKRRYEPVS